MAYEVLHIDDITDALVAFFANLLPEKNVSRNSDNWKRLRALAGGIADLHAHIDQIDRDILPDTAKGDALDRWGVMLDLPRKGATPASGVDAGLIRGTNGSTWTTSDVLVHKSGKTFRPSADGTMGVTGQALVSIVAISTGSATRLAAGEILEWQSTPSGLEAEVELQVDLDEGGLDAEEDGSYRVRLLNRMAQPELGGSANDWKNWVLESSDTIETAYIYPDRHGPGSVDVAALKDGTGASRLLDAGERADLLAYLEDVRPVSAAVRVLEVLTDEQDVEFTVTPESGSRWAKDWDDSVPPTVGAWNASTRLLTFTTARPDSMAAGDRIVIRNTSGVELVIESLSSTDAVVLVDAKGQTPTAIGTSFVYSGGPLTTPVRDALIDMIDNLGPRVGDYGLGDWESMIRISKAFETVQTTEGVLDSTPVTPAANVDATADPAYPNDDQVYLLIPGMVLVRYV